jgi:FtsP/CotA-like multicopper oxidase with cupredoxin domain
LNVARGQYLFRILDGSNLRFYNISIVNDQTGAVVPFVLVAKDGGDQFVSFFANLLLAGNVLF